MGGSELVRKLHAMPSAPPPAEKWTHERSSGESSMSSEGTVKEELR